MNFEAVDSEAVITVQEPDNVFLVGHTTFRLSDFLASVRDRNDRKDPLWKWLLNGVPCQYLKPNQNWQTGRIKLVVAFVPDSAEQGTDVKNDSSELEELRQISTH